MRTRVAAIAAAGALIAVGLVLVLRDDGAPPDLDRLATGVALMEALDCAGEPLVVSDGVSEHRVRGTGFLVGARTLMGVEHAAAGPVCGLRARLGGNWYDVVDFKAWSERGEADRRGIDLATATLARNAPGHVFRFAKESPVAGSELITFGHPRGGPLERKEAVVTKKLVDYSKPTLAVKYEPDIEGGESGGPLLNDRGEVVGVNTRLVISANLTSDGTARGGGVDLARWWGESIHADLCRAHPEGGIPDCDDVGETKPRKLPVDIDLGPSG